MPNLLQRLIAATFPAREAIAPPVAPRLDLLKAEKEKLENTSRRPRPSTDEKIPSNYHGGIAGKVWFLPFADSATKDTPEIRAAMRRMRADGYVKAAWEPQILTVASEDWQVQPAESGNRESEEQANFCKTVIEDYLEGGIISGVRAVCAPFGSDGFSIAEKVPGVATRGRLEKKIVLNKLAARDVDNVTVRLQGDRFGNVTGVQSMRVPGQEVFPISDFVYSRYMTVFDEPLGEAAFRSAYSSYWMRDTVRKLRVIHHEKRMAGMLQGTYQSDDERPALEEAMRRAKTSTWVAVPDGTKIEAIQLSTASEPDYRSFDESLRDEIVTAIAFATLQIIQGNVPDARGDSKTQKAMADLGPWLLMSLVSEAFNKQVFPDLIDWNFPYPAGGGYPKLTFGAVSNQELLELLQVVEGAKSLGLNPSKKHYAKALSIQEADPNDPDDSLNPQQPPQGDPYGGMGGMSQQFSEIERFGWSSAKTSRNTTKAVGTGEDAGKTLYGKAAAKALASGSKTAASAPATSLGATAPTAPASPRGVDWNEPRDLRAIRKTIAGGMVAAGATSKAAKRAAKATVRATAQAGSFANRVASRVGMAASLGGKKLAQAGAELGRGLATIGWLENSVGLGSMIRKKSQRAATRWQFIADGFKHGFFSGKRRVIREAAKVLGIQYHKSAKKYGPVLGAAVEAAMFGWTWGTKGALIGLLGTSTAGLGAAGAAIFAAGKVGKYIDSYLGIGPTTALRNKLEHVAGGISAKIGGQRKPWGPATRNSNAPGRVAQQLDWAEGLSAEKLDKAVRGKGVALWYVTGDRRATGSGRGGKVMSSDAVQWLLAKHEVLSADREGRPAKLDPSREKIVRRAMEIQGEGKKKKVDDTARQARVAAWIKRQATNKHEAAQQAWLNKQAGFSEFAEADEDELVLDLREGVDNLNAALGMPPSTATDDELKGSLAVVLARMSQAALRQQEAETFADEQRREGEKWETNGRWYQRQNGTSVRIRKPGNRVEEEASRQAYNARKYAGEKLEPYQKGKDYRQQPAATPEPPPVPVAPPSPPKSRGQELLDRARARQKDMVTLAPAVKARDPQATAKVQEHAAATIEDAGKELAKAPPEAAQHIARAFDEAVPATKGPVHGIVRRFLSGLVGGSQAGGISGHVGKFLGFLGKLGGKALKLGVRSLARFAWWATKKTARTAKNVLVSDTMRPFLWWAGTVAATSAIIAAPVLAVNYGLISGWSAFLASPAVVAGASIAGRKLGGRAVGAGLGSKYGDWINEKPGEEK